MPLSPASFRDDAKDSLHANAVFGGKLNVRNASGRITGSYAKNGGIRQLRSIVVLFLLSGVMGFTSFGSHVGMIVASSPNEQMGGIAAFSIVTFMADEQPIRNRAVGQFKGNAVCSHKLIPGCSDTTVSRVIHVAIPFPARIILPNTYHSPEFVRFLGNALSMPSAKTLMDTLDLPEARDADSCDFCGLPATTLTQSNRNI